MDVLLDDVVAGEPLPVHPVADVPFHVRPAFFALTIPEHTLVPIDVAAGYLADESCLNLLVGFHVAALVVTLSADHNAQALCLSLLSCCHDGAIALGVDGDGLFEEGVHAFLRSVLEHLRAEDWGRGEDDHVDAGVDDLLVGIEADEAFVLWHFLSTLVDETVAHVVQAVFEDIAQGNDLDVVSSIQEVDDGSAASTSTSDETYLQLWAVDGFVRKFGDIVFTLLLERCKFAAARATGKQGRSSYGSSSDSCGTGKEAAPAHGFFFHSSVSFVVIMLLRYYVISLYCYCVNRYLVKSSQTMRKPMPLMSLSHQMLFGFCGSVLSQAS